MTLPGWITLALVVGLVLATAPLLGGWMARVYEAPVGAAEAAFYRACGVDPSRPSGWRAYAGAMLASQIVGFVAVYALQRWQGALPLDPEGFGPPSVDSAFDTAVSFVTNTNWQGYGGESTMSYLTQALGLTVQNFLSAATGMAVLAALARGFAANRTEDLGNFWVDLVRGTVAVLLPLSLALALLLVSQGVVQTVAPHATATLLDPVTLADGTVVREQAIAVGPVASQVAIKQLGTNGGGFYNANGAHPLENPTPLSNLLETWAILALPAAFPYTFGRMVRDPRQGRALLAAMLVVLIPLLVACAGIEAGGNPRLAAMGVVGPNLEGKEVRFGIAASTAWAVLTTAASNGSVNSMHDSYLPLGGLVPMVLMQLGEVVFGGVGSGLYGLVLFAIVAVFLSGLMVGRTPEYLGKKIEAFEMQMAAVGILAPCVAVLAGTALAVSTAAGRAAIPDPGAHGFSEVLYAFSSAGNNNGSAFAGLGANTPFYNVSLAVAMLVGRYAVALPVLAVAGALARKTPVPPSAGTLPTHGPLFVVLLVGTVVLVGALTFLPALALGPVVEHLLLSRG